MNKVINSFLVYSDAPQSQGLTFQDAASSNARELILFHDNVMIIVIMILILVGWFLGKAMSYETKKVAEFNRNWIEHTKLEFYWTCLPAFILLMIALPSIKILYSMDEVLNTPLTIKVIGHQWYWSYEYSYLMGEVNYDSYMVPTEDLEIGQHRLLEVDAPLYIPTNVDIRLVITGADVIHSFAVPSLAVKADAIPGRLNQSFLNAERVGTYYGQCSEICGSDHSFMPICVKAIPLNAFLKLYYVSQ